jgi:aspartyl-tRNA(Asn)/glutamyl-tRNA(Gln) amidotransferase subunit B
MFEECIKVCDNPVAAGNWLMSDIARIVNEREEEPNQIPFTGSDLGKLIQLIDKGTISSAIAKKVLEKMFENPEDPEKITKDNGWIQISDEDEIKKVVNEILEANPQSIADYKAGKDRALGFLVGQAMKATKGKANPQLLNKLFIEELKK